ncbi:hypothetical protein AC1031_015531 [Aphanomyces cochlioides]|nr:hypothetical protein AC1031_015531 [Aphanomyces cochlioides]
MAEQIRAQYIKERLGSISAPRKSSAVAPPPDDPNARPLPRHRVSTLSKVKGVEYLQGGRQVMPPLTLHGRILTNVDPRSRERAQKRWDTLRDVVSRTPELTRITQKLQESIRILKMPPSERKDTDIAHLYSWLMSQENLSSLFQTMPEKMGKNICRELEFLHLRSNDVIVHQGDIGCTCFILISGLVSVFVRSPDEQLRWTQQGLRDLYPPDPSIGIYAAAAAVAEEEAERGCATTQKTPHHTGRQLDKAHFGSKVATLKPGATFGEICLIEPDSRRTATVAVDAACSSANFIVLSSSSYTKMTTSQRTEGSVAEHIEFLHQMYMFRTWSKMQLMRLASSMRYMVFPPQQYIQRRNAETEYFFMILSGEAREVTSLVFNQPVEAAPTTTGPTAIVPRAASAGATSSGSRRKMAQHKVTVELTSIGKYDVACEHLIEAKKTHQTSPVDIRAETTVVALGLSKKLFHLYVSGQPNQKHVTHTIKVLEHVAEARHRWRDARIHQATMYPDLLVKITSKMMRLSGNMCMQCGRCTHIAGDSVCLVDAANASRGRKPHPPRQFHMNRRTMSASSSSSSETSQTDDANNPPSPTASATSQGNNNHNDGDHGELSTAAPRRRRQLLAELWDAASKYGVMRRPKTAASTSVTTEAAEEREEEKAKPSIQEAIAAVRRAWPYGEWQDAEKV